MNPIVLYRHYLSVWRRFKVQHLRDSFVEIMKEACPFGRNVQHPPMRLLAKRLKHHQVEQLRRKLSLRACHVPLQYIVRQWSFRYIAVRTVPPVFIPRFETEQLLTILQPHIEKLKPARFLDLCCGSGVIAISLAKEFGAAGVAVDIDPRCIRASQENSLLNKLPLDSIQFVRADCIDYLCTTKDRFNLIVSNPPYLREGARNQLSKEVIRYESHKALFGGPDGLDYVRAILDNYRRVLLPGGILAIEYGGQQLTPELEPYVTLDFYGQRRFIIVRS